MDYIAVTSSLRLEDALTRAKLIFARGIQYIMEAVAEDGVCCSNTRCSIFDKRMLCSAAMIDDTSSFASKKSCMGKGVVAPPAP